MTTLGTMIDRVVNELHRTELTTEAEAAIRSAIEHYENERLWVTETSSATTTVAGQETYPLPDNHQQLDSLTIIVSNDEYPLIRRSWEWLVEKRRSTTTFRGYPKDFAIYRDQIYLYPTPAEALTMTAYFVDAPASLTGSTDSNIWMTKGEQLIRARAKWDIAANVIHDDVQARRYMNQAEGDPRDPADAGYLGKLLEKSVLQITTSKLRPRHF